MAIEVGPTPVVDCRGAGILMTSSELDVPQRHAGIERRHDECRAEHVRMDVSKPGPSADGTYPAMSRTAVQAVAILAAEDRSLAALTHDQIDGSGRPRDEWNDRWLVALAQDP